MMYFVLIFHTIYSVNKKCKYSKTLLCNIRGNLACFYLKVSFMMKFSAFIKTGRGRLDIIWQGKGNAAKVVERNKGLC